MGYQWWISLGFKHISSLPLISLENGFLKNIPDCILYNLQVFCQWTPSVLCFNALVEQLLFHACFVFCTVKRNGIPEI